MLQASCSLGGPKYHKYEKAFSVITRGDNISWRGSGGLQYHIFLFLMENSILKKFGSVDVKITPNFCS